MSPLNYRVPDVWVPQEMTRLRESIEDVINGGGPSITGPIGNNEPEKKTEERTHISREAERNCLILWSQKMMAS